MSQKEPSLSLVKDGSFFILSARAGPYSLVKDFLIANKERLDCDAVSVPSFTDKGWFKEGIIGPLYAPSIMVDIWQVFDYISTQLHYS
jgi:hypothetical protein